MAVFFSAKKKTAQILFVFYRLAVKCLSLLNRAVQIVLKLFVFFFLFLVEQTDSGNGCHDSCHRSY